MSDLSSLLPGVNRSFRLSDGVAKNLNDCFAAYVDDGFEWEWVPLPMLTPNGLMFKCALLVTMPTPVLGGGERFMVSDIFEEVLVFTRVENVRHIVFTMTSALRKMKDEFLRGNQ